ncbi:Spo0E family sporulation regulatory protein-aspartic acid phosphatase [Clostridium sp. D2Q-14]|nr:aspartyl-phosphate phosphatase Spo0E family protein [Anaeromonas gelatinilytica]MBS4535586.1 Spo0E family sporulation regulatory protein-aspartic acid phosphatase [Anaeromonas gelatinilytica]
MEKLRNHIEELREQLNQLVQDMKCLDEEKILEISEELDEIIYQYIKKE